MTKVKKKSAGEIEKRSGQGREGTASLSGVERTPPKLKHTCGIGTQVEIVKSVCIHFSTI